MHIYRAPYMPTEGYRQSTNQSVITNIRAAGHCNARQTGHVCCTHRHS